MRFRSFFGERLTRRVFSPKPKDTICVLGSFFVSGHTDGHTHTRTDKMTCRAIKIADTVRGTGKKRARSLLDRARPLG